MSLLDKKCLSYEGFVKPFDEVSEKQFLQKVKNWNLISSDEHKIIKTFRLLDFVNSIKFVNKIAEISEVEGHHPNISIKYNIVDIELFTHSIGGLSENDFILAAKIDEVFELNK
ncbi:MAG: 4a-hydroxytetrahydrobiopterin dehydratase [Ignavibacteriae bacterium]|nr:4a-hydroxytetrahydrobiopterin dehydratase [Ignavibacteriota bacterium]